MAKELESFLVVSKVKDRIKAENMRSGDEFLTALNETLHKVIEGAIARAKASERATLKAEDI